MNNREPEHIDGGPELPSASRYLLFVVVALALVVWDRLRGLFGLAVVERAKPRNAPATPQVAQRSSRRNGRRSSDAYRPS